MGGRHIDSDHIGLLSRKNCGFCREIGRKERPKMNTQLPHRHKCKSCGILIDTDCECGDKRVFALVCDTCHDREEDDTEGDLEF